MKIRAVTHNKTGRRLWCLDYGCVRQPDGTKKRKREFYPTKDKAIAALADAREKREWRGDSALTISFEDASRFLAARDALAPLNATLEQAVAFYLRHHQPREKPVTLRKLLELCLEEKAKLGRRDRYLQQLRSSCVSFIRGREERLAHTITRDEVKAWILGNGWAPKTQRIYLGDLRTLFSFGLGTYVSENPCAPGEDRKRIELAAMEETEIDTFNVSEAKALLRRCAAEPPHEHAEDFRELLTYHALGLFCGIRPAELARMKRGQVNLEERHAEVRATQAKTRRRRVVDISENAVAWLRLDPLRGDLEAPVAPPNFRRRWERLREAAGVRWSHDIMRHTFASMHYAQHQNESVLKAQLGHASSEDVLFNHYRALKTRAEAAAFWNLAP